MKLLEMNKGDSNTVYFINYWNDNMKEYVPFINDRGYNVFGEKYLIQNLTEVKKITNNYRVYRQTTVRVE